MATILNNNILTNKMINLNYNNIIMNQQQPTVIQSGKRLIVPATERNTVVVQNDLKLKRKMNYPNAVPYGQPGNQPASVARRNARERNRVKQVNNGFATLRQHIPQSVASALSTTNGRGTSKKLSKVDTLRMAVEYIRSLKELLDEHDSDSASTSTSNSFENSYEGNNLDQGYFGNSTSGNMNIISQTPPSSETSASPTPSFASEGSLHAVPTYTNNISFQESYENYEPMSPEDEELLDVISWWQQQ